MPSRPLAPLMVFTATLLAASAGAQAAKAPPPGDGPGRVVATDSGARLERLAEGVYAIVHDDATEEWPHGNTGVIVGDDGVLVIDSDYLPARAVADIALIRRVTPKPVRYLVNTHWHGDHTHGNGVYRDAFPGLAIVGPRESRSFIELNLTKLPRGATAPDSPHRRAIAQIEARLAKGTDSAGAPLAADVRQRLVTNLRERRTEVEELGKVKVAPPNLLFEHELVLYLSGRRVELRNRGPANSPADVTVWLPEERILFTGDIVVHPLPYAIGAWPAPWIDVLRQIEALPVVALVPGHGAVMRDQTYPRLVRELLEAARTRVDSLYRAGKPLAAAVPLVDLGDFRTRFLLEDGKPATPELWARWSRSVAEQMAQCVHGYRC
jgi:cyclase